MKEIFCNLLAAILAAGGKTMQIIPGISLE
jgi:hypothetical protein